MRERITKADMATAIIKALYNVEEIGNEYLKRQHRAYCRWSVEALRPQYANALTVLKVRNTNKKYIAIDKNGLHLITVYARNATDARYGAIGHLRQPFRNDWQAAGCPMITPKGITIYWAQNLERWVTIPDADNL